MLTEPISRPSKGVFINIYRYYCTKDREVGTTSFAALAVSVEQFDKLAANV